MTSSTKNEKATQQPLDIVENQNSIISIQSFRNVAQKTVNVRLKQIYSYKFQYYYYHTHPLRFGVGIFDRSGHI